MSSDRIEKTGWIMGALFLAGSLPFRSLAVSAGIALGVIVALLNYRVLARFVRTVLAAERPVFPRFRLALYFLKYAVTAAVIFAALKFHLANAIAILIGASVLLPAIGWETIATQRALREEA